MKEMINKVAKVMMIVCGAIFGLTILALCVAIIIGVWWSKEVALSIMPFVVTGAAVSFTLGAISLLIGEDF